MFREVFDELSIEVGESEEGLYLLLVRRSGPLGDTGDESLTSLAVYFRNWHMFHEDMNNIPY